MTPIQQAKIDALCETETVSSTIPLFVFWLSGLGALLALSLTGLFLKLDVLQGLPVLFKYLSTLYFSMIICGLVCVGAAYAFQIAAFALYRRMSIASELFSEAEFFEFYLASRQRASQMDHIGGRLILVGALFSICALVIVPITVINLLFP